NVVRIIGSDVGFITVRDLVVDCDRDNNPYGEGDPNVSHARFEYCGIKAYHQAPGGPGGVPNHDITIEGCRVLNSRRLGIMLEGSNMKVLNNVLGNAFSDSVEILTGPGEIRGNYAEITGRTHVAIGSDRGNSILMSDNIIHVKKGGHLDIGFRSWAASDRHVISGNVLTVEEGGKCEMAMDIRGEGAAVTGNCVHSASPEAPVRIHIGAGNTVLTGNVLENVRIEVEDQTGSNKPILIRNNILENSRIEHTQGNLIAEETPD
ncbi:MAG: right-handed parallel beta-helix repeat-containing protein, partial [Candidatus Omnitrophica bacterium]|nr:right-handed parallel beta-helix repeat-containing protein [Candidatus Omnitrophota bacterium]